MRLSTAIKQFITVKSAIGRSQSTLDKYTDILTQFAIHTNNPHIHEIDVGVVAAYLNYKRESGATPSSLETYYRTFVTFFNWCSISYETPNPMREIDKPNVPQRLPEFLSDEEILKMIRAIGKTRNREKNKAILYTLIDTGIRAGELITLKRKQTDLNKQYICVFGKDKTERLLPICSVTASAIQQYWDKRVDTAKWTFLSRDNTPLTNSGLRSLIKRLGRLGELDRNVYPHLLRHTFAHSWLASGGDLETLRKMLGHSNLNTTQRYMNTVIDDIRNVHNNVSVIKRLILNN